MSRKKPFHAPSVHTITAPVTMLVLTALLVACAPPAEPDAVTRGSTEGANTTLARDGSFSVEIPQGWSQVDNAPSQVALALQKDDDEHSQVVIARHEGSKTAESQAVFIAAGFAKSHEVMCKRREDSQAFAPAEVFIVCPWKEPEPFHKVLVPVVDGERSALIMLQADGADLGAMVDETAPIVRSFAWR